MPFDEKSRCVNAGYFPAVTVKRRCVDVTVAIPLRGTDDVQQRGPERYSMYSCIALLDPRFGTCASGDWDLVQPEVGAVEIRRA